ncbi:MAG: DUF2723 domain-containing protein [Paludibacteraceae bacterium]|nr:DUF2723 domain-containing protein [Paludibacteraceae bacterium]
MYLCDTQTIKRNEQTSMRRYTIINNLLGWIVFAIALTTYALTIEPTASFWDCPEFISTAFKLDVGHPPGAPFFMLTGKFFSLFASDATQVARMVNLMSATMSALCILFLFWTITHMARRLVWDDRDETFSIEKALVIFGSGVVGALVYTFSDTFWFSAVEGEVYAYSSFLTAVVFWLMLKWEDHADEPGSDKYLIGITYLMGISIGVHLLNLLTIPAIVLLYYFRKHDKTTFKGTVYALLISFGILLLVLYGLVPGFITLAGGVELFFVNKLHLPFNSGALFYCVVAIALMIWSVIEVYRTNPSPLRCKISFILTVAVLGIPFLWSSVMIGIVLLAALAFYLFSNKWRFNIRLMSTSLLCMVTMLIGYSCYALIVVRSSANPPMDQNSPDNVFALKSYLNREQYGDRPLFYGPYYSAEPVLVVADGYCKASYSETSKIWGKKEKLSPDEKDEYVVTDTRFKVHYDPRMQTIFPRMHSMQGSHAQAYSDWLGGIKGRKIPYDKCGRQIQVTIPTFGENLKFFFTYQLNYMYFRYLLWNFSGRQNDIQGHGEATCGNWITGIPFIDNAMLGEQVSSAPMLGGNKGHNVYYMLPLLLGLIGIVFQTMSKQRGAQSLWVTFVLFFMTGIAIVLYLNQGPSEPRERDYAYAGSFYAFSIWVGLGVAGLAALLKRAKLSNTIAAAVAVMLALPVPALMAQQNWDDHDRSNRYVARDFGRNYFNSAAPNAIIFTNGDNDTFPLWYLQETEEDSVAVDKRVCNLSYLQTDWYIDQMRTPAHKSAALPISWERNLYAEGTCSYVYLHDMVKGDTIDLKLALDYLVRMVNTSQQKDEKTSYYLPAKKFRVPVNADNLIKQGAVTEAQRDQILPELIIDLSNKNAITKAELMILVMLAENNWERPIYYAVTVGSEMYLNLQPYFQLEGMAYRIVPLRRAQDKEEEGWVNADLMYDNMMHKFQFGNVSADNIYLDENALRMCYAHRQMFERLIHVLVDEGRDEQALKALNYCLEVMPGKNIYHTYLSTYYVGYYYKLGATDKARQLSEEIAATAVGNLEWLARLEGNHAASARQDIARNLVALQYLAYAVNDYDKEAADYYFKMFAAYESMYKR